MFSHLIGLLFNPSEQWKSIRDVDCTIGKCYCSYVFIMAAIAPVSGYFGTTRYGWEIGAREAVKLSPDSALVIALAYYLVMLVGVFSMGALIYLMGKTNGAEQKQSLFIRLAAFTATPLFLEGYDDVDGVLVRFEDLVDGKIDLDWLGEHTGIENLDAAVLKNKVRTRESKETLRRSSLNWLDRMVIRMVCGKLLGRLGYI